MNQLLSNAASRLAAGALKTWTVVTNVCRTMLVDQTKSYQPEAPLHAWSRSEMAREARLPA